MAGDQHHQPSDKKEQEEIAHEKTKKEHYIQRGIMNGEKQLAATISGEKSTVLINLRLSP